MLATDSLVEIVAPFLKAIAILPRRLQLKIGAVDVTLNMLRGTWGACLHDLDEEAYQCVFAPDQTNAPVGYLLREPSEQSPGVCTIDWFLFGSALVHDQVLCRAWDIASGRGLGSSRFPFLLRQIDTLDPTGGTQGDTDGWLLADVTWPGPADAPCWLTFPQPTRLRRNGRLILQPTLVDIVVAAWRRVHAYLPPHLHQSWKARQPTLLESARRQPVRAWKGRSNIYQRYSARQKTEVEMFGISGVLQLPEGPGELWPLLAAAQWLHVGQNTAFGLGQVVVETHTG